MRKTITFISILITTVLFGQNGWYQKASHGGNARHRCTAFSIGNKGYFGGGHINSGTEVVHEDYWEYDPATNTWSQIANFGGGKRYHSVAFVIDNVAYVGCGEDAADLYYNDFWQYNPIVNTWFPAPSLPGNPRRGASSFVINNEGYVGLGQSDFGYEVDFYKFNKTSNTWETLADFIGDARSGAVGFSHNGLGYIGTGHILGEATKDFYSYDPEIDTWTIKANVGERLRQDATGFVLNDKGYILTGNNNIGDSTYQDVWEYDFELDIWTQVEDFPGSKRRYMVSFVIGNIAYAGSGTNGTNLKDFWAFQPLLNNQEITSEEPQIIIGTDNIYIETPDIIRSVTLYSVGGMILFQHHPKSTVAQYRTPTSGVYILQIEGKDHVQTKKIIIP